MTFWIGVTVAYVVVASLGLALGRFLADRFPRRDSGGGRSGPQPAPAPKGPKHALECPPLGSAFDRALLPGAFAQPALTDRAA
jgi:hypothetical protein